MGVQESEQRDQMRILKGFRKRMLQEYVYNREAISLGGLWDNPGEEC